jgi:hypothetical protein
MKRFLTLVVALAIGSMPLWACVGARPLGMGGAFIAVADDADATYWNPAGLAMQDQKQAKAMLVLSDEINYKSNLAYVAPLEDENTKSAWGVNLISYNKFEEGYGMSMQQSMAIGAYGRQLNDNLAVGASIARHATDWTDDWYGDTTTTSGYGLNLGVYGKTNDGQLTWGVLVQDLNEPTESGSLDGESFDTWSWTRNVRPGIAIHPKSDPDLVIAADIYNLLGAGDEDPTLCVGAEKTLEGGKYAVRTGLYRLGSDDPMFAIGGSFLQQPQEGRNGTYAVDAAVLDGTLLLGGSYTY